MPFWSGETIIARNKRDNIISDFRDLYIDCGAVQLHMGREVFITPHAPTEPRYASQKLILTTNQPNFSIPPGQFAFLLTKEFISIPIDTIAFISMRSRIKYLGLVNVSGFHVDPGFRGNLIYAVYNAGPQAIQLAKDEPIFLIWFADLDRSAPEPTAYHRQEPPQTQIPIQLLQQIPGQIYTLQGLSRRLEEIDRLLFQVIIGGGVLVAAITIGLAFFAVDWSKWVTGRSHVLLGYAIIITFISGMFGFLWWRGQHRGP